MSEPVPMSRVEAETLLLMMDCTHRRNALDHEAWAGPADALQQARLAQSTRVVVLTGADGAFCSSQDIGDCTSYQHSEWLRFVNDAASLLHHLPKPTVARVTSDAVGAGWNSALALASGKVPEHRLCPELLQTLEAGRTLRG